MVPYGSRWFPVLAQRLRTHVNLGVKSRGVRNPVGTGPKIHDDADAGDDDDDDDKLPGASWV